MYKNFFIQAIIKKSYILAYGNGEEKKMERKIFFYSIRALICDSGLISQTSVIIRSSKLSLVDSY